jgi:ferredoxin
MGSCLAELSAILSHQGFTIPGAGNFVAEHSFVCDEYPVGRGRPDAADLKKADEFGRRIVGAIASGVKDITVVYRDNLYIRSYVSGSTEAPGFNGLGEGLRTAIHVSDHDDEECTKCDLCVEACPTGAIAPVTYMIEDESCIRCFACTSVCPTTAKEKVVNPPPHLAAWFTHRSGERSEPLLFM